MVGLEGQVIGGCRIMRRLGGGGMGEVYLAEQVSLKRQVAIKLVRPEAEPPMPGSGASLAERFAREAQAIAAMKHPHILPVYDFGEQDGLAYLVMEYAPNGSLQQALTPAHPLFRFGLPLSLDLTAIILDQAAQALQHAHDHGVLHRDVKPANFLMGEGPPGMIHLLLADFGLAKFTSGATHSGVYSGTAAYSAPEQIQQQATPASDQYSLAAMAYLLLTARLPFQGGLAEIVAQQLDTPAPSLRLANSAIPPEVDAVILRALAKRPEERWPSVIVFAAAYREACARVRGAAAVPAAALPLAQPLPGQPGMQPVQPAQPAAQQFSPPLAATAPAGGQPFPPGAGPTQIGAAGPGGMMTAPPARQTTVQTGQFGDDSFVAAGPTPLPPIYPPVRPRRAWTGWAALVGGVGVVVAIILIITLVNGRLAGNSGPSNTSGNNGTPGITGTPGSVPVVPGAHIKSVQTGLDVNGDLASSCQNFTIKQPTTTFHQSDLSIWVVFTVVNDGNPNAQAGAALIGSNQQIVSNGFPGPVNCPGTAAYVDLIDISHVPPGQYAVGVFYSETFTLPQQPEVILPVIISA